MAPLREKINQAYGELSRMLPMYGLTVEAFLFNEERWLSSSTLWPEPIIQAAAYLQGVADALGMDRLAVIQAHVHEPEEKENVPDFVGAENSAAMHVKCDCGHELGEHVKAPPHACWDTTCCCYVFEAKKE